MYQADKADKYQDEESVKDLTFAVEAGSAGKIRLKELVHSIQPFHHEQMH